jgi:hypothetical protein
MKTVLVALDDVNLLMEKKKLLKTKKKDKDQSITLTVKFECLLE